MFRRLLELTRNLSFLVLIMMSSRKSCSNVLVQAFSLSTKRGAAITTTRAKHHAARKLQQPFTTASSFASSSISKPSISMFNTRLYATETDATETSSSSKSSSPVEPSSTAAPLYSLPPRVKTVDVTLEHYDTSSLPSSLVTIQGWVRTIRKQKTNAFIQVNDGSNLAGIQCVVSLTLTEEREANEATNDASNDYMIDIHRVTTGAAVEIVGRIVSSTGGQQALEVSATSLQVVGDCPPDQYPLAKKRHSLEYLRQTLTHLRPRTNTLAAVSRIRSLLAGFIHSFFQTKRFVYVQTPLITTSDCEGAGELFRVTTLDLDRVSQLPLQQDADEQAKKSKSNKKNSKSNKNEKDGSDEQTATISPQSTSDAVDYAQDFFGKAAFLTVSGQLGGETYATALGDVYTFGPTFRAENSQTTRHLAEFHMVEPEMAFCNLDGAMDNAEAMLKYVVEQVLEHGREDLEFLTQFYDKQLLERLQRLVDEPFARVSYRQAIAYLQEEIAKDPSKWQFPVVEFGTDLATEHERWLAETKFESAVFVYNYPKAIKAFYMRDNDEDNGETVQAMDLLVPGVGELIGGSQREERLDVLVQKLKDCNLNPDDYWWYLDLRRYGSVPHSGYGLGFERLVTYVCGLENIRDAIAYPRYPGNAEF
ncbi:hypothetical protein MPSEU_001105600 [Mayamaea pseudoterrestris]|nr:hypothetical protein MPSEU_001105600 [Mayamaea pseudoterrestris]